MPNQANQKKRHHGTYDLVIRRKCQYKEHGCKVCGFAKGHANHKKSSGTHAFAKTIGCARCGLPKKHRDHFGIPPSLNILGSGNPSHYISLKQQWGDLLLELLEDSGLPKGLDSIEVSAKLTFPDQRGRDEGNLRFLLEKTLGDVLVRNGWIPDDTFFPVRHYTFAGIEAEYQEGVSETRLTIWPD